MYPLQNLCASKSTTHGFASKLDTRHNRKGDAPRPLFCWLGYRAKQASACACAGSHSRRKPTGARSREARRGITERSGVSQLLENIISAFFDSEFFRNFADAFRAFRFCRQILTGETAKYLRYSIELIIQPKIYRKIQKSTDCVFYFSTNVL